MIDQASLECLERMVIARLDGQPAEDLDVIGYGEISTVLRAAGRAGPVAAKRLPMMTAGQLDAYREVLCAYVEALKARGVPIVATEVHSVGNDPVVPYCVQPLQDRLLVDELKLADSATVVDYAQQLVDLVAEAADGTVGVDAQISNWAIEDGQLRYFDVTTPLLRDEAGEERANLDLFIVSLPWLLRGPVRRFLLGEILSHYYTPRPALLDAIGNLHKERLPHVVEPMLDAANRLVRPAITSAEVAGYYKWDARMWAVLQRLRRADRFWRRRRYDDAT